MNWYKKAQEEIYIPPVLYHATFRNNLKSIMQIGLDPSFEGIIKCWTDCKNGIYLHADPDVAFSYAEVSEDIPVEWIEKEDNIIVFEVKTSQLDINLFEQDPNLPEGDNLHSYLYNGIIPANAIRMI